MAPFGAVPCWGCVGGPWSLCHTATVSLSRLYWPLFKQYVGSICTTICLCSHYNTAQTISKVSPLFLSSCPPFWLWHLVTLMKCGLRGHCGWNIGKYGVKEEVEKCNIMSLTLFVFCWIQAMIREGFLGVYDKELHTEFCIIWPWVNSNVKCLFCMTEKLSLIPIHDHICLPSSFSAIKKNPSIELAS